MPFPWTRYVALGDSLTEGLEDARPDGMHRGWADRLAQHLADASGDTVSYANLAIRGRLLGPILSEQVEPALALQPTLVSLWGGGNDMLRPKADPTAMAAQLEDAVARFRAAGADVIVGTSTDPRNAPIIELTRERCMEYNLAVWALARRHGAYVLDAFHLLCIQDWRMWFDDRIHMNGLGHERVGLAAATTLGLTPVDADWDAPLPPLPRPKTQERLRSDATWANEHLRPWLGRRLRRTSSGFGRQPKHPDYVSVDPQDDGAQVQRAE